MVKSVIFLTWNDRLRPSGNDYICISSSRARTCSRQERRRPGGRQDPVEAIDYVNARQDFFSIVVQNVRTAPAEAPQHLFVST